MPSPFPQMFGAPEPNFEVSELPEGLLVTRTSIFTKKRNTMLLPITSHDFMRYRRREALVQVLFPGLTPDQREFLMSGATPEEWADVFSSDEEGEG